MKHILPLLFFMLTLSAVAQPPARRRAEAEKTQRSASQTTPTGSAYRDFPVAPTMPDDAAWRRDMYLSINLTREENAALYYPVTPQEGRMNLFTYLFKLMLRGQVKAYDYKPNRDESFADDQRVSVVDLMERFQIPFEKKGEAVRVLDADIPSDQVKLYYVKTSQYFDQHTATFRSRVTAICPVLQRGSGDDITETDLQFPMFWLKYSDIAPYLAKHVLMASSVNNAATMTTEDFFSTAAYKGDIIKTANLQDRYISEYCPTDEDRQREQRRIEREVVDFQDRVWGRDSVAMAKAAAEKAAADSIAAAQATTKRSSSARRRGTTGTASSADSKETKVKEQKPKTQAPRRSGNASLSVRRQRH